MDRDSIERLNVIIRNHNQYKRSQLWTDISVACECTFDDATILARTHCNMISFYAIITAEQKYYGMYRDFLKYCLDNKFCDDNGYINVEKSVILESLDIKNYSLVKHKNLKDKLNTDKFYQMKIKSSSGHGDHFMACYAIDGKLYLSDTSFRGIGIEAEKYINRNNLQWIMEV